MADAPGVATGSWSAASATAGRALDDLVRTRCRSTASTTRSDDLAYIVYTSGTTKDPKGVVHDAATRLPNGCKRALARLPAEDDLVWCTAATGWAKSLWNVLLGPWSCGAAIVMHEADFDAARAHRFAFAISA